MNQYPEEKFCPFLFHSSNENCYYKNMTSLTIPKVVTYCSDKFVHCHYYKEFIAASRKCGKDVSI